LVGQRDTSGADFWSAIAKYEPLGILTDLDGTLLPFASTPEAARPTEDTRRLIDDLASLPGVTLIIVSGRSRDVLDQLFPPGHHKPLLVAEHGAWRRTSADTWESMLSLDDRAVDSLAEELGRMQARHPGSLLERKTWSIAFHYRRVPRSYKTGLIVQASTIIDPWIESHPDFEALGGAEVIEIRPRKARKGNAVAWARALLGPTARLLIVGDDVTDEDMFTAAGPEDATAIVGADAHRATAAQWRLGSTEEVLAFYRWLVSFRRRPSAALAFEKEEARTSPSRVTQLPEAARSFDLLVVSNRLPELRSAETRDERKRNVGGLVSALAPVLSNRNSVWLGWSGRTRPDFKESALGVQTTENLSLAWVDLPEVWHRHYYNGLSNCALWPLFHSFPTRARFAEADWHCYEAANAAFAGVVTRLVGPNATIWVHDYHLLLLGKYLRERGHTGPIGLFQHIPFPGPDIFFLFPWANEILEAMLSFDLVGFHTKEYVENFLRSAAQLPGARVQDHTVERGAQTSRVGAFPIGIIPEDFQEPDSSASDEIAGLIGAMDSARMVLGVDRLDYTKGIPERIDAFGRMLELFPEWRRKACMVQVSVPSRGDIPDYAKQRSRVENAVGRVNGELGEADWVPIRYLYRSYGRSELTRLYRAADVGYVTPLRDGMNLVAKEFVAAQDPQKPGVLLLSRFAGAAEELDAALLTNPWHKEGTARDLDRALRMPLEERIERHRRLMEVISRTTAITWAEDFLAALAAAARR
jgi:trehalose 6-phosphate synthase